ncbi:MAG: hypothetical protein ACTSSN_02005 [Candidatus Heimdallarchaeaceae archaeon]
MTWKMVFKIYAEEKEKKLELTRYKLSNIINVKEFLQKFFEEQREWIREQSNLGKGLGYEIVFVDEEGQDLSMKNLYELLHSREDLVSFFSMTADTIGDLLVEGIS